MIKDFQKTAFIYKGKEISYKELIENVYNFSTLLDILPGERVCLIASNMPQWAYALYAIWRKGGTCVPIDHLSSEKEVRFIVEEVRPQYIFVDSQTYSKVKKSLEGYKYKIELINIENEVIPLKERDHEAKNLSQDVALILYTSGTTGSPKGVMLTFSNLESNIEAIVKTKIATKDEKTIAILPFHHAYPLMVSLLVPLHIGATIIFSENLSSKSILNLIVANKVTVLIGVPRLYKTLHQSIMKKIKENKKANFLFKVVKALESPSLGKLIFKKVHEAFGGELKYLVSGGAKLDVEVAKDLYALGFLVLEGYGLTETSPIVSFNYPGAIKIGSVGKPIDGVEVKIAEDGEILVKGKNVMKGYFGAIELTREVIKDGWFYTGDLGFLDEDGFLYITGRKKEIIVLENGKKVVPEELENLILSKTDIIKEVGITLYENKLKAIIYPDLEKLSEKGILNISEYIKWEVLDKVNLDLPPYKKIQDFILVEDELPKTRLGKIKRFLLKDFITKETKEKEKVKIEEKKPVMSSSEVILIEYLSKFKPYLKPEDHLELDLGMDSIDKAELLSFLKESFNIDIKESDLSNYQTVSSLMDLVRDASVITKKEPNWKDILKNIEPINKNPNDHIYYFTKALKIIFKLYFRFTVEGIYNLPKQKPYIIAPNHASYLDGFLIASSLPKEIIKDTYFIGAKEYFESPLGKKFAELFNVIPIDTQKDILNALKVSASYLKANKVLVIFPEGAREREKKLLPFKKGVSILSKELKVPVVPSAIKGSYEALKIGDFFPKPYKIVVRYGWPLKLYDFPYDEITGRLEEAVSNLLIIP